MAVIEGRATRYGWRRYSLQALALFARYRDVRAEYRPAECDSSQFCRVDLGPPGLSALDPPKTRCLGCAGKITGRLA